MKIDDLELGDWTFDHRRTDSRYPHMTASTPDIRSKPSKHQVRATIHDWFERRSASHTEVYVRPKVVLDLLIKRLDPFHQR